MGRAARLGFLLPPCARLGLDLGPERCRIVTDIAHQAQAIDLAGQPGIRVRLAIELAEQRRIRVGQLAELLDVLGQFLVPDLIGQHHFGVVEPLVEQRGLLLLDEMLGEAARDQWPGSGGGCGGACCCGGGAVARRWASSNWRCSSLCLVSASTARAFQSCRFRRSSS